MNNKKDYLRLGVVVLCAIGLYILYKQFVLNYETPSTEQFNPYVHHEQIQDISGLKSVPNKVQYNTNVLAPPQPSNGSHELSNNVSLDNNLFNPKDQLTSEDLLPRDETKWEDSNPTVQSHLKDKNFCSSGHHYGINTVGNSLKNANLQLRSDPVIPKVDVGPWNNSSYEGDNNRRQFEIGSA